MKRYIMTIALLGAVVAGYAASKFDATSRAAIDILKQQTLGAQAVEILDPAAMRAVPQSRSAQSLALMVVLNDGYTAADLEGAVDEITGDYGRVVSVTVPLDGIDALEALDAVAALQTPRRYRTNLDKARTAIKVTDIHSGANAEIGRAFDGTGVIAGIFDSGIDVNNPNFLDADGKPRASRVWYYTNNNGTAVELSDPAKIAQFETDTYGEFHGTHVLGCMAGSYKGPGEIIESKINGMKLVQKESMPLYGMAPGAELAIGGGELYDPNILNGVQRIIDYAKSVGRPAVINLSLGSTIGPHDGSDAFSLAIERMSKDAIICMASGNEADLNNTIVFKASDKPLKTVIDTKTKGRKKYTGMVEIWCEDGSDFTVTATVVDTKTGQELYTYDVKASSNAVKYIATNNYTMPYYIHNAEFNKHFSTSFLQISASTNPTTNKRTSVTFGYQLQYNSTNNSDGSVKVALKVAGANGKRIDMVNFSLTDDYSSTTEGETELSSCGMEGYTAGSGEFSISNMACAPGVIVVGAWNERRSWGCLDGYAYSFGSSSDYDPNAIAGYSSYGTLIDGTTLPMICAPGTGISSSVSHNYSKQIVSAYGEMFNAKAEYNGKTYYWDVQMGTSMASPIVAGAIALWLQADPTLTAERAIQIIRDTADQDKYTAQGSPVQWGAGKFNALAGLKKVLAGSGVGSILTDSPSGLILTPAGANAWEAFVAGNSATTAEVYNLSGQLVKRVQSGGDSALIDCSDLTGGVYVVRVNGAYSRRIAVR